MPVAQEALRRPGRPTAASPCPPSPRAGDKPRLTFRRRLAIGSGRNGAGGDGDLFGSTAVLCHPTARDGALPGTSACSRNLPSRSKLGAAPSTASAEACRRRSVRARAARPASRGREARERRRPAFFAGPRRNGSCPCARRPRRASERSAAGAFTGQRHHRRRPARRPRARLR